MADHEDRERFIPISKAELTDLLIKTSDIETEDAEKFREFSKLLAAYYHFEYHENLENLKTLYEPFDPDSDTVLQKDFENKDELKKKLFSEFGETCEAANYVEMSKDELQEAFDGWSPFGLNLKLDLDDYEEFSIYYRGSVEETHLIRKLPFIWKQVPYTTRIYKRLALLIKIKDKDKLKKKYDTEKVMVKLFKNVPALDLEMLFPTTKPAVKPLDFVQIYLPVIMGIAMLIWKLISAFMMGAPVNTTAYIKKYIEASSIEKAQMEDKFVDKVKNGDIFIKYSADVVDEDNSAIKPLEKGMLNPEQSMEWFVMKKEGKRAISFDAAWIEKLSDYRFNKSEHGLLIPDVFEKVKLTDLPYEIHYEIFEKNNLAVALYRGLLAGGIVFFLILFASWTFKSVMKFLKMKEKYVGALAQNLFFLNLDNNFGVFSNLINSAEEEEWKEAAFAYFFLNTVKNRTFTETELDDFIEDWVEQNCMQKVMNKQGIIEDKSILIDFEISDAIRKLEELELLIREKEGDREIVKVLSWDKALERIDYLWDNFFSYNGE